MNILKLRTIHAGLECGIIGDKYDGMDMISIGPNLHDVHSPAERLSVSSTKKVWDFICELMKNIPKLAIVILFMMASVGLMAQTPINLTDICIEGQPDSCLPGWTQGRYTLPYILPGYPDCKIILIYAMRTCTTSGGKIINQIVGQKIYTNFDPDDDCYELHKYITTGPDGNHMEEGNPAAISKIFNEGFRVAADSWFAVFKNQYPCEADIFQFYATYYRGSCVKYCTQTCIEENIMTTIITELNCQGIACCKIERKYCYDTETGETNVEETTTSHDPYYKPIPPGNPQHFTFMCGYEDPLSPVSCPELSHSCCIQKQTPCHKVCED